MDSRGGGDGDELRERIADERPRLETRAVGKRYPRGLRQETRDPDGAEAQQNHGILGAGLRA